MVLQQSWLPLLFTVLMYPHHRLIRQKSPRRCSYTHSGITISVFVTPNSDLVKSNADLQSENPRPSSEKVNSAPRRVLIANHSGGISGLSQALRNNQTKNVVFFTIISKGITNFALSFRSAQSPECGLRGG